VEDDYQSEYHDFNGTYYKAFSPVNSGTPDNPIIFKSYPRHAAILKSVEGDHECSAMAIYQKEYIIIDGFKVKGQIRLHNTNHCTIRNCDVSEGWYQGDPSLNWGIRISGSYNIVENNYVHDMKDSGNNSHNTACIMVFYPSEYNIIQNNLADAGGGIVYSAFGQKGGDIYYNIWRYNIARNAPCGFLGKSSTDETDPSEDNIYYQNIIINCNRAFELTHECHKFKIYNNTAYNCPIFIKAIKNNNTNIQLWNNIAWGNNKAIHWSGYPEPLPFTSLIQYSDYNSFYGYSLTGFREKQPTLYYYTLQDWQSATGFDQHSIEVDPLFTNPEAGNFHLQPTSPCLNAVEILTKITK